MNREPLPTKCHHCHGPLAAPDKFDVMVCMARHCQSKHYPKQAPLGERSAIRSATMLHGGPPVIVRFVKTREADLQRPLPAVWRYDIIDERIRATIFGDPDGVGQHYNILPEYIVEDDAWHFVARVIGPISRWEAVVESFTAAPTEPKKASG
jgi:hypothetical protein